MSEIMFMAVSQWNTIPVSSQEAIATGQALTVVNEISRVAVRFSGISEPPAIEPNKPDPYINDLGVFKPSTK